MISVSVLIPTLPNRADHLKLTLAGFTGNPVSKEILTITGHTWGEGLNQLAKKAQGEYWLCCCDDTVPAYGWFWNAKIMLDGGVFYPASAYFHPDGTPLHPMDEYLHGTPTGWCRSFLLTRELYEECGPFMDATWYTDIEYSERISHTGREIVACKGFDFTHLGSERDWLTPEVQAEEERLSIEARAARSW